MLLIVDYPKYKYIGGLVYLVILTNILTFIFRRDYIDFDRRLPSGYLSSAINNIATPLNAMHHEQ